MDYPYRLMEEFGNDDEGPLPDEQTHTVDVPKHSAHYQTLRRSPFLIVCMRRSTLMRLVGAESSSDSDDLRLSLYKFHRHSPWAGLHVCG